MGPGNHTDYSPHCLRRDFSPSVFSTTLNQSVLDWTRTASDFWTFEHYVEGLALAWPGVTTHGGGHFGVGGQIGEVRIIYCTSLNDDARGEKRMVELFSVCLLIRKVPQMTNMFSSPGDPLFFLHHGGLDWLWWTWQQAGQ